MVSYVRSFTNIPVFFAYFLFQPSRTNGENVIQHVKRGADLVRIVGHKDCAVKRIGGIGDVMGRLVSPVVTGVLAVSWAHLDVLAMLG